MIGRQAYRRWARYVWSAAAHGLAITLLAWPLLWWLDLPGPFVLALLLGMLSVVPYVGIPLAGAGVMLFAWATTDVATIAAVGLFILGASVVQIAMVRRRVDAETLYVGPAVPVIVGLLGWQLYGFGGALYGIILAVGGLAVIGAVDAYDAGPAPSVHDDGAAGAAASHRRPT